MRFAHVLLVLAITATPTRVSADPARVEVAGGAGVIAPEGALQGTGRLADLGARVVWWPRATGFRVDGGLDVGTVQPGGEEGDHSSTSFRGLRVRGMIAIGASTPTDRASVRLVRLAAGVEYVRMRSLDD